MLALGSRAPNWLIQLLLQSGADPHLRDSLGRTVLYYAVNEQNVWAVKRLITENVDIEVPIESPGKSKPVFRYLLDNCYRTSIWRSHEFTPVLNYLRAMQVLALVGKKHLGNSFTNKWTQTQLIDCLNSIMPRLVQLSKASVFRNSEMMGRDLQEIRDIVHDLTDMLSNPLSLSHLCRVEIRRSLGRDFHRGLGQLNIPLPLKEYLRVYKDSDIVLWFLERCYLNDNAANEYITYY